MRQGVRQRERYILRMINKAEKGSKIQRKIHIESD
jgi:hypothetical protein